MIAYFNGDGANDIVAVKCQEKQKVIIGLVKT